MYNILHFLQDKNGNKQTVLLKIFLDGIFHQLTPDP
jgi:hypothetical protein